MSHIAVSELEWAPPGHDALFFDVGFTVAPGEHAALIGVNGVGKSTILRILSGEIEPDAGSFSIGGTVLRMTQDVGMASPDTTLREMLIEVAPPALRAAGQELVAAERAMLAGDDDGVAYAHALHNWGDLGGYTLEGEWDAAAQRSVKTQVDDFATRTIGELSGGERKRLVLDVLLNAGADVLLLDEPDNYLDVPTRGWLEDQIKSCKSTILMVSHDRTLLSRVATKVICIEGSGCWVHGGSYATFPEARARRQQQLGDDLQRWKDEERRLYRFMLLVRGDNLKVLLDTWKRSDPLQVVVAEGQSLPGLIEGIQGARVGGTRVLTLPPDLAFGPDGEPGLGLPAGQDLIVVAEVFGVY